MTAVLFRYDVKTDFFTEDGIVHPIRGSDGYDSSKLSSAKPAAAKPAEKPAEASPVPVSTPKTVTGSAGATGQKMPDYDALMKMKTVPGFAGTHGAVWKQDADGQKYIVKPADSEAHAYNEVAAGAVMHAAGVPFPNTSVVHDGDDKPYVVSQGINGLKELSKDDWESRPDLQKLNAQNFGVDALLSNWDVIGLEKPDNIQIDPSGTPVRIETGGAMNFGGLGAPKPSFDVGEDWTEPQSMRTSYEGKIAYGKMTDAEAADSLEKVSQLSIGKIKQAWTDAGVPKAMATKWGEVLRDRKLQVPAIVAKLRGDSEPKGPAGGHSTATVLGKGFFRTQVKEEERDDHGRWTTGNGQGSVDVAQNMTPQKLSGAQKVMLNHLASLGPKATIDHRDGEIAKALYGTHAKSQHAVKVLASLRDMGLVTSGIKNLDGYDNYVNELTEAGWKAAGPTKSFAFRTHVVRPLERPKALFLFRTQVKTDFDDMRAEPAHTPARRALANEVHARAVAHEPGISKDVSEAMRVGGARLSGYDFRLKQSDSIARKVAEDAQAEGISEPAAAAKLHDTVRYTAVIPAERYTEATKQVLHHLSSKHHKVTKIKNTWRKSSYKAVHAQMRSPKGHAYEVQFHTPESQRAQQDGQNAYEASRNLPEDHPLRKHYDAELRARAAVLSTPPRATTIGNESKTVFQTQVKEWDESEHPRGADGRFGEGDASPKAVSAQAFSDAFHSAMSSNQFKAFVSDHSPEEIKSGHMVPLLANGGKTGILVHDHGDGRVEGTALFNNNGPRGAGSKMLQYAVDHHGVNYVECYGPVLAATYARLGFKDTAVYPFDRSLAAPDWDYEKHGEPEYHTMSLQPETKTMNLQDQFNAHLAHEQWDDADWLDGLHQLSDQLWQQDQPDTWDAMTSAQRENIWNEALSRM